ncbi:MAG: VCBS repeat-containing protein, partial [Lentisphaerae bacterium]|nr:VCBS repeat-containing protein [Lentisphaerota bacterium]
MTTIGLIGVFAMGLAITPAGHAAEYLYVGNGGNALVDRTDGEIQRSGGWVVALYKSGPDGDIDGYNDIVNGASGADDTLLGLYAYFGSASNGYFKHVFSTSAGNAPSGSGLKTGDRIYTRVFDSAVISNAGWCAVIDDELATVPDFTTPPGIGWMYDPGSVSASDWLQIQLVPPAVPSGVSASDGTYSNKVRITWNASPGATAYEVWRHTTNDATVAGKLADTAETVFDDITAVVGKVYYYWVKAGNVGGSSGYGGPDQGWMGVGRGEPASFNDFDGDGVSDLAVFDRNTGYWYIRTVSGTLLAWTMQWGWTGAEPVSGDYDGDGISDLAVFDQDTGYWYVLSMDGRLLAWA